MESVYFHREAALTLEKNNLISEHEATLLDITNGMKEQTQIISENMQKYLNGHALEIQRLKDENLNANSDLKKELCESQEQVTEQMEAFEKVNGELT